MVVEGINERDEAPCLSSLGQREVRYSFNEECLVVTANLKIVCCTKGLWGTGKRRW